ncbi:MAG: hypothetical protein KDC54_09535, partial [Lewinella sp.]|nr:hypothetical protein [Lewinella sp.]
MGVTLHYRGRLRAPELVRELTEEVQDICKTNGWSYRLHELEMDEGIDPKVIHYVSGKQATSIPLRGIHFQPHPESESVMLTFTPDGRLLPIVSVLAGTAYPTLDDMFWAHTKTQFASAETHAVLCKLLRYLADKYFSEWEVLDEAQYWETGDLEKLQRL